MDSLDPAELMSLVADKAIQVWATSVIRSMASGTEGTTCSASTTTTRWSGIRDSAAAPVPGRHG